MYILDFNTLPRESETLLELSFYNIIVKSMGKISIRKNLNSKKNYKS